MYSFTKAIGRRYGRSERWKPVDLKTRKLVDIFNEYKDVWVWVGHTYMNYDQVLDLNKLRQELYFYDNTFVYWLATIGNRSLPVEAIEPTFETKKVICSDLWAAGYRIDSIAPYGHPDSDLPRDDETNLIITRPNTDYETFGRHCLVSVNGLIHRTDYSDTGVHVIGGGKSNLIANRNQISAMSFLDVGELSTVTITPEMIHRSHPNQALSEVALIETGMNLENKMVGIVIGGYLHLLDKCYSVINGSMLSVHMKDIPFPQRWFESKGLIDLESIELIESGVNKNHLALEDFYSDETIKGYLSLTQSFIVLIDTPHLYVERHAVSRTKLPGRFIDYTQERFPLIGPLGKVLDYHRVMEGKQAVLAVHENFDINYQFETTHWMSEVGIDNSMLTPKMKEFALAYMWEIGRDM